MKTDVVFYSLLYMNQTTCKRLSKVDLVSHVPEKEEQNAHFSFCGSCMLVASLSFPFFTAFPPQGLNQGRPR